MTLRTILAAVLGLTLFSTPVLLAASDTDKNRKIEDDFTAVVQSYHDQESNKRSLSERKDAVSKALGGYDVHGWTGVIRELSQAENGDYVVALTVGDAIVLRSGGALPEYENKNTVIKADSELCGPLGRMKLGQKVTFDGELVRDRNKGPNKGLLAGNQSLQQMEFAFQLLKIRGQKPPPAKTWKQIVDDARAQILALHNAGGGKLSLYDFAHSMQFKMKGDTETMVRSRGDLVFTATGDHSGEFTNEGPVLDIKCKVGHIEIPSPISGTYTCSDDRTVLTFSKKHTFEGKVGVIGAPLESITADAHNVTVKIGGILGGALSRTLPTE